jgi:hypothetical protein
MANPTNKTSEDSNNAATSSTPSAMSVIAPAVGWLVPGAGHLVQRRYGRGVLLMASIVSMYMIGIGMQGHVYSPNGGDLLDILSFLGDACAGGLYIVSRALDWNPGLITKATADYGSKFIVVAGLLNFISAADAYHIAIGKKQ